MAYLRYSNSVWYVFWDAGRSNPSMPGPQILAVWSCQPCKTGCVDPTEDGCGEFYFEFNEVAEFIRRPNWDMFCRDIDKEDKTDLLDAMKSFLRDVCQDRGQGRNMATRSEIAIYEKPTDKLNKPYAIFYKHWDGYPDVNLPICMSIMRHLDDVGRMDDTSYAAAQVLYYMMRENYDGGIGDGCGFGIQKGFGKQEDAEWYYAIYPDRLECYQYGKWDSPVAAYSVVEAGVPPNPAMAAAGASMGRQPHRGHTGDPDDEAPDSNLMFTETINKLKDDDGEPIEGIQEFLLKGK